MTNAERPRLKGLKDLKLLEEEIRKKAEPEKRRFALEARTAMAEEGEVWRNRKATKSQARNANGSGTQSTHPSVANSLVICSAAFTAPIGILPYPLEQHPNPYFPLLLHCHFPFLLSLLPLLWPLWFPQ